ncbi:MAG: DUF4411 family protein [Microlunatus sp.]|nr:DUF4411 family protein [Microlunatus sp.]
MSRRSRPVPAEVRVIDTGALIELKKLLPVGDQWPLLVRMTVLVEKGHLAFPRQVTSEVKHVRWPDAPGAWAAGNKGWCVHSQPRDEYVAEALGAAQLTDPNAESDIEPADPYVVAMALQIRDNNPGCQVYVVTTDRVDRMPAKESVVTACDRLVVPCSTPEEFVDWLREQDV